MKKLIFSFAMVAAGSTAFAQISAGTMMLSGSLGFGSSGSSTETSGAPAPFVNGTVDGPKGSNFNFSPSFGYFLQDNLAVGISVNFGSNSSTVKSEFDPTTGANGPIGAAPTPGRTAYDNTTTSSGFGIGLFANMYNELNSKWLWYYGATLGFSTGSGSTTQIKGTGNPPVAPFAPTTVDGMTTTNISLGANIGMLYFLTDSWAMSAGLNNLLSLNYQSTNLETPIAVGGTTTAKTNNLNLGVGTGGFGLGAVNVGVSYFLGR